MDFNVENITSIKEAEELINQIKLRIQNITENEKFDELKKIGFQNKLSFSEILEIDEGDKYYLVIPKYYPHQGSIIKVEIEKVNKINSNCKVYRDIHCKSIQNDMDGNKLDNWIFPTRPNLNYLIQVRDCLENKTVTLEEPHILSNSSSLWKAEFYRLN